MTKTKYEEAKSEFLKIVAEFDEEAKKTQQKQAEEERQKKVIEALNLEIEALKKEAEEQIEADGIPNAETFETLKRKERELEDKKEYLTLFISSLAIKQQEQEFKLASIKMKGVTQRNIALEEAKKILIERNKDQLNLFFSQLVYVIGNSKSFYEEFKFSPLFHNETNYNNAVKNRVKEIIVELLQEVKVESDLDFTALRGSELFEQTKAMTPTKAFRQAHEIEALKEKQKTQLALFYK